MSVTARDNDSKSEGHPTEIDRKSAHTKETNAGTNQALEFTPFSKLPIKLRLKIWEETVPPPRFIIFNIRVKMHGPWVALKLIQAWSKYSAPRSPRPCFPFVGSPEQKSPKDMHRYEEHYCVPLSSSMTSRKMFRHLLTILSTITRHISSKIFPVYAFQKPLALPFLCSL